MSDFLKYMILRNEENFLIFSKEDLKFYTEDRESVRKFINEFSKEETDKMWEHITEMLRLAKNTKVSRIWMFFCDPLA